MLLQAKNASLKAVLHFHAMEVNKSLDWTQLNVDACLKTPEANFLMVDLKNGYLRFVLHCLNGCSDLGYTDQQRRVNSENGLDRDTVAQGKHQRAAYSRIAGVCKCAQFGNQHTPDLRSYS
jgi:hypothetical protein